MYISLNIFRYSDIISILKFLGDTDARSQRIGSEILISKTCATL